MPEHWRSPTFLIGVALAVLAAWLLLTADVNASAPIALLICGIAFITNSRKES